MIRVTVEIIPKGDESKARTLGVMEITNDGTGGKEVGHYTGTLHAEYTNEAGRSGYVGGFHRRNQVAWGEGVRYDRPLVVHALSPLYDELERRGYDMDTFRFSVNKPADAGEEAR